MMVEDCRHAIADAVDHAYHGAPINVVEREHLVEPPPQTLQNLLKVAGRCVLQRHAAGKGAVEMGVCVDEAGHDHAALRIEEPDGGMDAAQLGSRSYGGDEAIVNERHIRPRSRAGDRRG